MFHIHLKKKKKRRLEWEVFGAQCDGKLNRTIKNVWDPRNCWHNFQSQQSVLKTMDTKECWIRTRTHRKRNTSEVYCMAIHISFILREAPQAYSSVTTLQLLVLSFNSLLPSALTGTSWPSWTRQVWTLHPLIEEETPKALLYTC